MVLSRQVGYVRLDLGLQFHRQLVEDEGAGDQRLTGVYAWLTDEREVVDHHVGLRLEGSKGSWLGAQLVSFFVVDGLLDS